MSTRKEPEKNREQDKTTEHEISELIQLIDDNSETLFRNGDFFKGWIIVILGLFALMPLDYVGFSLNLIPYGEYIGGLLAILAVLMAVLSIVVQTAEERVLGTRFGRALKLRTSFTENQKLILKALIKIRSKHPKFALKDAYNMDKETFTEKRLLEKLYE